MKSSGKHSLDEHMTQVEVAKVLGVTPQRVGQIERAALEKIKAAVDAGHLPAFAAARDDLIDNYLGEIRIKRSRLAKQKRKEKVPPPIQR